MCLQVLFRKYGWSKLMFLTDSYRVITGKKSFDDYSSRGSNVHAVKKYHRNIDTIQSSPDDVQLAIAANDEQGRLING